MLTSVTASFLDKASNPGEFVGDGWSIADELAYRYDTNPWTAATDLAAYLRINATIALETSP